MREFIEEIFTAFLDWVFEWVLPLLGFLLVVAVLIAGLCVGIRYTAHHYGQIECRAFAAATDRETKFVDYSWWTWDCLTPSRNGKWIPTSALYDEVDR